MEYDRKNDKTVWDFFDFWNYMTSISKTDLAYNKMSYKKSKLDYFKKYYLAL